MKSKYDYEIIHDYLHGLTDAKTSGELKELLKRDEVARSIAEGIVHLEKEVGSEETLDSYLENLKLKQLSIIRQQTKPVRITKKVAYKIAASIVLLITVGVAVRLMVASPGYQELVDVELAQPYPVFNLMRGEADESPKDKGYQLYEQGDFATASLYFQQVSPDDKDLASVTFYNGLSYLYAGDYKTANALLESATIANSRYEQQGQWFRALALIKAGNKNKARELLTMIESNEQHYKRDAARALLNVSE
jgi:tetratricopeptide (TPR) repeat protein